MAEQAQLTPEQQQVLKEKLSKMSPEEVQKLVESQCLFCKIINGEIPAYTVYEDSKFIAFLDIRPANPGHVLVVPKKHYSVLPQMSDKECSAYFNLIKNIVSAVYEATGAIRVQIAQFGIHVPHLHMHVIPRFEDDGLDTLYDPYEPKQLSEDELKKAQKIIKKKLKNIKPTAVQSSKPAKKASANGKRKGKKIIKRRP